MELEKSKRKVFFSLRPVKGKWRGVRFGAGRKLLGCSESCEIFLPYPGISPIHAALEIRGNAYRLYDMNSSKGTRVNDKIVVSADLKDGDVISFGANQFIFEKNILEEKIPSLLASGLPPVIESDLPPKLQETTKTIPEVPAPRSVPKRPKNLSKHRVEDEKALPVTQPEITTIPRVEYPLSQDPHAEFSEYIFEDAEELYPIFSYDVHLSSVEIIVIHQDKIFSVDYLPQKNGTYHLVGRFPKKKDVEYPYLGRTERCPFIEISEQNIHVIPLSGYQCMVLSDYVAGDVMQHPAPLDLRHSDIIRFAKDDIQIFVRRTEAPPEIAAAPFFRRDKEFKKYLFLISFLLLLFLGAVSLVTVDKKLDEEQNPERIATILYKKQMELKVSPNPAIAKTPDKPEVVQKAKPEKPVEKVEKQEKKVEVKPKGNPEKIVKQPRLAPPKPGPTNDLVKVVKVPSKSSAKSASAEAQASKRSAIVTNAQGSVDTYKAIDFNSTISKVLAKGGATKFYKATDAKADIDGDAGVVGTSEGAQLVSAKVSDKVGSLTGVTRGEIDSKSGLQGLAEKKSVYTMGIPSETVVLGAMDPDVIRRILKDHIPQFRSCYQSVLDKSQDAFNGVVPLNFTIGSSGHVTQAGIKGASEMPSEVRQCVIRVLKGILFPEPMGGGRVEVNQPFYFYPKMN